LRTALVSPASSRVRLRTALVSPASSRVRLRTALVSPASHSTLQIPPIPLGKGGLTQAGGIRCEALRVTATGLCYISAMPGQLDPTEARALSELKAQLTTRFAEDIAEMLLYGSKARGDAGPDSDIDVLVVVRPGLRRAVGAAAAAIVSQLVCEGAPYLSVVVTDTERWSWETPFTHHVKRDALPL